MSAPGGKTEVMLPSEEDVEGGSSTTREEDEGERAARMKRRLQMSYSQQSALKRSENPREGAQHGRVVHRSIRTLTLAQHLAKPCFSLACRARGPSGATSPPW